MAGAAMSTRRAGLRWRTAFIRMPYARELTVPMGVINDTFETAVTWDRFEAFHEAVRKATEDALVEATGRSGHRLDALHPRLSGRARPSITPSTSVATRPPDRAMAAYQDPRLRRADRGRRHDHPPSCGRARPHALVSRSVRTSSAGRSPRRRARSTRRHPEPRRAGSVSEIGQRGGDAAWAPLC